MTPRLAEFYGVACGGDDSDAEIPLPLERVGVLTSAGFAAAHAHADRTSPTLRGRYIREALLCQKVPDPPEDVAFDTIADSPDEPKTLRERLARHATDPACSTCHEMMDPLGFALEHFDAVGRFRELELGEPVDTTGNLDGVFFDGAVELSAAVAAHSDFPSASRRNCFGAQRGVWKSPPMARLSNSQANASKRLPSTSRRYSARLSSQTVFNS